LCVCKIHPNTNEMDVGYMKKFTGGDQMIFRKLKVEKN